MIRECSKFMALTNAQAVMASAVMFRPCEVVTLSVNKSAVVLTLIYDYSWIVEEREVEWLTGRCLFGIKHWSVDDPETRSFTICVAWEFNPDLK